MRRLITYLLSGLAIILGFLMAFSIIVVLVAKDHNHPEFTEKWMVYVAVILVVAIPAVLVWAVFRLLRNHFFAKIRRHGEGIRRA